MDKTRHQNFLVQQINQVKDQLDDYRRKVRSFYFRVILSTVKCPQCDGRLKMTGQSRCACACGLVLDPTIEFQTSQCCGAKLLKKTFHYVCSRCGKTTTSRFIFNERVFDKTYFKEMMRTCRERKKRKQEEIRKLLASSRSNHLDLMVEPDLDAIPDLLVDLDEFILSRMENDENMLPNSADCFQMEEYRSHILSGLNWNPIEFSAITPLMVDNRRDRACRFITLIFMQNEHEVEIQQLESDLLIQKVYSEAHG